jgi:short-subunit dehydrogenase
MRRRILITGASSGLGAAMARLFAARGRDLALAARRVDRLEALATQLRAAHPGITVVTAALDVTDSDQVFAVFRDCARRLDGLDRVIVNAGVGKGAAIGTGRFVANREVAMTNFVAALAQCEAAMEIFTAARAGHLVVVSSVSAMRGMPGSMTTYAATKVGVAALAEGLRADVHGTPIRVTTLYPGFIRSEMTEGARRLPFVVDTETGCNAMVAAIEREVAAAAVPAWPWRPLGFVLRHAPVSLVHRLR